MQVVSSWYIKNLGVEAKKGMRKKAEQGGWPFVAPFGYVNKGEKNKTWVEPDPVLGPLVTQAFEEMATGKWTLVKAASKAAVAAGADGLLIEVHPNPAEAFSDGEQSLKPRRFVELMAEVKRVAEAVGRTI